MSTSTKTEKMAMSEASQTAWRRFLVAHARIKRELDRRLESAGHVDLDVYEILLALENAENQKLRMSDLADRKAFSRSGLTRLADRLEEQGLIAREPCLDDRRGSFAVLTAKGKKARHDAHPAFLAALDDTWGQFVTEDNADKLISIFDEVIKAATPTKRQ